MNNELLESLLHQQESETLDFKLGQYPFDKATDDEKGELLKDLLAFANAWRTSDAHILIGVEEKRGGRSHVSGVSKHILNHNLQQFVQSKMNRPLSFTYSGVRFDGCDLGVITIPVQDRPLYLLKDFGQLKANTVYIRRGDSTAIASPDEVFKMGRAAAAARLEPALTWEFADLSTRTRLGEKIVIESTNAVLPPASKIPQYGRGQTGVLQVDFDPMSNPNYYKELAMWVKQTMPLKPVGLSISNSATIAAEDVVVTLEFDASEILVIGDSQVPLKPSPQRTPSIRPASYPEPQRVDVSRFGKIYEVRASFGTVQPGTTSWSAEPFYVGAEQNTSATSTVTVSANNLGVPRKDRGEISVTATHLPISVRDLIFHTEWE